MLAAIVFNAVLAAVNASVAPLSQAHVIAAEAAIVGAAVLLGLLALRRTTVPVFLFLLATVAWGMVLAIVNGAFDPKIIRDAMIIPTFVLLGAAYHPRSLPALMGAVVAVVLAGMAVEVFATPTYESLLNIKSYYINTRGFTEDDFWNRGSDLFVSATRPDGTRFVFDFLGIHRLSSVFLEPVSLGNFAVALMVFLVGFWHRLTVVQRVAFAAAFAVVTIGSDGRLALVLGLMIAATAPFARLLPRYAMLGYLPACVLIGASAVLVFGYPVGDDFAGRLAVMARLFGELTLPVAAGIDTSSPDFASGALDSGIVYLIATQSILGTLALWVFAAVALPQRTDAAIALTHAVCLTMALTLLVSYSFFSIKFGALIWFMYGYAYRSAERQPASAGADRRPAPRHRGARPAATGRV